MTSAGKSEKRLVELRQAIHEGSNQFRHSLEHRSTLIQTELQALRQAYLALDQNVCNEAESRTENDHTIHQYCNVKFQALLQNWEKSSLVLRSQQMTRDLSLIDQKMDLLMKGTSEKRQAQEKELQDIVQLHHNGIDELEKAMNEERSQVAQFDVELQRTLRRSTEPLHERIQVEFSSRQRLFELLKVQLDDVVHDTHQSPQRKLMDRVLGELLVDMENLRNGLKDETLRQQENTQAMANTMAGLVEEARRAVDRFNAVRGVDQVGRHHAR